MNNKVVLVDEFDQPIGEMDKLEAHLKGVLHRAFSIFLFNPKGEILIHQRALSKYHGGGLWTNACCSHPQLGEDLKQSALDRLQYEMGITCDIHKVFSFIYHAPVENGLIEHEYDHVFIGETNKTPVPNPSEVQNFKWKLPSDLQNDIVHQPHLYTYWFKAALPRVLEHAYNTSG